MQALLWRSRVVTAFHLVPAAELAQLDRKMESDVVACGDDDDARHPLMNVIEDDPRPAGVRRRLARERGRHGDVRRGAADDQHPAQGEGRPRGSVGRSEQGGTALRHRAGARSCPFVPGPVVRMYVCGITPYDSTHLGHAATYLTYDLLIRRLEELGHEVRMVRNVTDVDDSILPKARRARRAVPRAREAGDRAVPRRHGRAGRCGRRSREPRATETIDEIISMVERLLDSGHAYLTHGTAYFDVSTSGTSASCRTTPRPDGPPGPGRGGNPDDPHRRGPLDFVLWQPRRRRADVERAVGVGRPGWHVECSAMAMHELGPTLDLHGGGTDLIFPHHECEIAQSEARHGRAVRAPLDALGDGAYEGEKMSKSLGNLVFISDLLRIADPRAIRLALMRHHYRPGFEWHDTDIDDGNALLHRLVAAGSAARRPRPAPYAERVAARSTPISTRRRRSRRSASSPTRSSRTAPTHGAPAVLPELAALIGVEREDAREPPAPGGLTAPRSRRPAAQPAQATRPPRYSSRRTAAGQHESTPSRRGQSRPHHRSTSTPTARTGVGPPPTASAVARAARRAQDRGTRVPVP